MAPSSQELEPPANPARFIRGSLRAIGNAAKTGAVAVVAAMGPVGIGLAALTVGVVAVGLAFRREFPDIDETLKQHDDLLARISDRYVGLKDRIDDVGRSAQIGLNIEAGALSRDLDQLIEREMRSLDLDFTSYLGQALFGALDIANAGTRSAFGPIEDLVDDFRAGLKDGSADAGEFQQRLSDLYRRAGDDADMQKAIEAAYRYADGLGDLQTRADQTRAAILGMNEEVARSRQAVEALGNLRSELSQIGSTPLSLAQQITTNYQRQRAEIAMITASPNAMIGSYREAYRQYQEAMGEIGRDAAQRLTEARDAYENAGLGDNERALAEIRQRHSAELEDYRRTHNDMAGMLDLQQAHELEVATARREQANEASQEARELAAEYGRAAQERMSGYAEQVGAIQLEIKLLGQSEGATAAARLATEALAEAKRAAAEAGMAVSPEEIAAIQAAAAEVGVLTDQLTRMKLAEGQAEAARRLEAEISTAGMSEAARAVAMAGLEAEAELRRQNISLTDEWGAAYVRNAEHMEGARQELSRQNEVYEEQRALIENLASTFLDIFDTSSADSFFDRVIGGFADIGRQLAELGKNRVIESLLGEGFGYTGGAPAPGQRSAFPGGFPAGFSTPANDNRIDVRAVGALNDNLQQSSRSALDVAKQFNGLNERADSAVLDSFMRASGNWNNLSASDTAWCAAFANAAIVKSGGQSTGSNLASSFMGWGQGTNAPQVGDIVVLKPQARGASGHVGFVAGFGDGTVQVFGGNQSQGANTRSFGLDQVRGYRTGSGLRSDIAGGFIDAQRQIANGQAGLSPSAVPIPTTRPQVGGALGGGADALSGVRNFLQSPMGQAGLAGVTAFAGGMQSGSPAGGALQGALGGFMVGGPIGGVIGAVGGLLGGLFGSSKRKKEERRQRQEQERQQRLQAQQQLDQQLPAILELQDTLLDRASGTLTKEKARIEAQLKQYAQLAKTAKNKTEIDRLASMQDSLADYMARLYDQVRLTAESIALSLEQGRGLEPEFAKAVAGVREQSLAIRNYLADLTAAAGAESDAVARATAAGRTQLLRQLSGAEEVSEIYTRLDALSGTAAQLGYELQKLGMNAEDAATAIREHLNRGIEKVRDEFVRGIVDEMADAADLGHLPQFRELMERRDAMRADAVSLGADPALIDRWFGVQAQAIADGAGLAADELKVLIDVFPELASVVGDSLSALEQAQSEAEDDLRRAWSMTESAVERATDQLKQFRESIADFLDGLKLNDALTTLDPRARLNEAEKQFRDTYAKAIAGDTGAQGDLARVAQAYLEEGRSFWTTSEQYGEIYRTVEQMMTSADKAAASRITEAQRQLGIMREQVAKLIDIDDEVARAGELLQERLLDLSDIVQLGEEGTVKGIAGLGQTIAGQSSLLNAGLIGLKGSTLTVAGAVEKLIATTNAVDAAQAARDTAQAKALRDYVKALNPAAAVPEYAAPNVGVTPIAPAPAPPPVPTAPPVQNVALWNGSSFQNYVGNYGTVNGRQIFIPSGWTESKAYSLHLTHQGRPGGSGANSNTNTKRLGGAIGRGFNGLGYQSGGLVANGLFDVDSVMARHRDGGEVALAGGEFVTTARGVNAQTRPVLEFINRTHRLPDVRMPTMTPVRSGAGHGEMVGELQALRREVAQLRSVVGQGAVATVGAIDTGNRIQQSAALRAKRRAAA